MPIVPETPAILSPGENGAFLASQTRAVAPAAAVSWNMQGIFGTANRFCDPHSEFCMREGTHVMILLITLSSVVVLVICAFAFFREDKEEQITPLCPQLVVKDADLSIRIPLHSQGDHMDVVDDTRESLVCKISMDWPDPYRMSPHGVAATARVHSKDTTLATVVARNVAVLGQGFALCRAGCEIFGFVEPEGDKGNRYHVRHRTGVPLLTLIGNFDTWEVVAVNPVGSTVCTLTKYTGDSVLHSVGKVTQHVDAGLVICALMAAYLHQRLIKTAPSSLPDAPPLPSLAKTAESTASTGGTPQIPSEVQKPEKPEFPSEVQKRSADATPQKPEFKINPMLRMNVPRMNSPREDGA